MNFFVNQLILLCANGDTPPSISAAAHTAHTV
jgi:hypothetical protein